jgi:hypothetical protein
MQTAEEIHGSDPEKMCLRAWKIWLCSFQLYTATSKSCGREFIRVPLLSPDGKIELAQFDPAKRLNFLAYQAKDVN